VSQGVPPVLTVLRVDVDARHAGAVHAALREAEDQVVAPEVVTCVDTGVTTLVVAFHLAGDALAAAVRLAGGGRGPHRPRMVLSTGEVVLADGRHTGPARERVDSLAARVGDATALLTAATAVMVSHALPPGAELIDLGATGAGPTSDERAYELRLAAPAVAGGPAPPDDAGASNLGWAHRAASRVVVGRHGPLARLEGAWAAALDGDHRLVILSGDPGIGKTTLAAEIALRSHAAGGTVLYGRWDEDGVATYQAVREALGSYAAACPRALLRADVAPHADELARLLPDLGARIGGVRPPLSDDPDAERLRLFDAVRHWLGAIARRRPVLLVLDDLQWAERSSLLLLRHLVDTPPDGRVLTIVTLRDGEVEGMGPLHTLGSFERTAGVDRLDVPGLGADEVAALVADVLGRRPHEGPEAEAARWLADETAGNPLFVHEILRGLDPDDPPAALVGAREHLPERLHDVVHWRLARLSPEANDALATASFVGEEFSLDVLAATLGDRVLDLRQRLDDAVRAGVVRETDDGRHLAFAHAVVRRALRDDVPGDRAGDLHRRIALALADGPSGHRSAPEIARHLLQASDAGTAALAIRWGRTAADQARRETAFESAVWFLDRVVDVHDRFGAATAGDGRAREVACELRLDLAEAHDRAGEFIARDRRYLDAADLARAADRTDLFTKAALGYGGRLPAAPAPNPTARTLLDEALDRLPPDDSRARALVLARLAHVMHAAAPHEARSAIADEAEAIARRLDAPVVLASVLVSRVLALDGPDDVDDHLDIGSEVIRIGEQTGDPDLVLQGARARIHPLFVVGAHDAARDLADRFTQLAETVRHPDHLRIATMWPTMWAALQGLFDDAEGQADELRTRLDLAGHPQAMSIHFTQTLPVRWMRGRLEGARPIVDASAEQYPQSLSWWSLQGWIEASIGNHDAARALLDGRSPAELAAEDPGYLWRFMMVGATVTATTVGHRPWAQALLEALAPYSRRNVVLGYAAYLGAVDHHLGTLESVLGRHDEAVEHLDAALERHRTIDARPWTALSAAWLANVLSERDAPGDAQRAVALHAEATDTAAELGLTTLPAPPPKLAT
jgi:tetratricopeptide (TPR) repeat protein